jgi:heme exporter protein D
MTAATHVGFIVAAYAAATLVVAALIAWVLLDYRALRRTLADLDRRGLTRRRAPARPEPAKEQA